MCFRPSPVAASEAQVQMGTCPNCGLPVAASVGIKSGKCPHCHEPIPADPKDGSGVANPQKNAKIL